MMRRAGLAPLVLIALASAPSAALATGHGPVFGLATPTLPEGGWSLDVSGMDRMFDGGAEHTAMLRHMLSYGITEDLQASLSLPIPFYREPGLPRARTMAMMPSSPDVEFLAGWRFQRADTDVGSRFETTGYLGLDYPVESSLNGVRTSPSGLGGLVTGYASRSVYAWVGGIYQRNFGPLGDSTDRLGDQAFVSLVLGYRPPSFREDYPAPDWRIFVETIAEYTFPDEVGGKLVANSGGWEVFVGPTLLGLYGNWGVSGGPLFPVFRALDGSQPREDLRLALNFTHWF